MKNVLEARNISRAFPVAQGEFYALKDVNIAVPEGSLAILKGRSGSGKTTLINILGALDAPTTGSVIFDGADMTGMSEHAKEELRRQKVGFIFQSVSLIPIMTAYENVEFALRLAGVTSDMKNRAGHCLEMVGLAERMHHMPHEMSGGEQQRVAIARAIAHSPRVVFADEPTAELDSATAVHVMKLFGQLVKSENITIVMTTHDRGLMDMGDVLFELEDGVILNRR
ncbi:MAG: ABC transporter ATP-binding protein [Lachnospiraceae bacterium]|nr:ABC transporter ATP-binding protein [Lachnospiraceae bacterium]